MQWKRVVLIVFLSTGLAGCGGGPQAPAVHLTSVTVSPSTSSYQIPTTAQFTATEHYSDGSSKDVTQSANWISSNTSVATVGDNAGSKGIATMVGSGTADIRAVSGSLGASATIIVSSSVTVSVTPSFASLTVTHQTQSFSAVVGGTSDPSVTWSVDGVVGGDVASGTISRSGIYTPPDTVGNHTITVTSDVDIAKSASATVAVTDDPGVFTRNYNNLRTSQNTNETVLTPKNVNSQEFGKLFSYPLDAHSYTQPLYVANVKLPDNSYHNIVYVATLNDTVYAFDADNPSAGIIWQKSLVDSAAVETPVPCADLYGACQTIGPSGVGIVGTPVIDPQTETMYVSTMSEINGNDVHKLHALDIATGAEKFNGPVTIQGSVPGTGSGGDGTTITFDPSSQLQRPALLLASGLVYLCFGSFDDEPPYHGWVFAYDAKTLKLAGIFNTSPDGYNGAIWQSGAGPAADASGNVYVMTANGDFNANTDGQDYGDSFLKLSSSLSSVEDYFTPYDQAWMNQVDSDLGSGGPVLLPDQGGPVPHLLIGGGKEGVLYLVNRDDFGEYNSTDDSEIVQSVSGQVGNLYSNAAYWNGNLYLEGRNSALKMFTIKNGVLSTTPVSQGQYVSVFPGLTPAVSSNKTQDGIVWTIQAALTYPEPGVLRAYDATDLSNELYDSNQAANNRDVPGRNFKFQVPTVVNGRVYIVTNNELDVYGRLPSSR